MFDFLRVQTNSQNKGPGIDFLSYSWFSGLFSVLIFTVFLGTYFYKYQTTGHTFNYSVDFTGGIQTLLKFNKPIKGEELVKILENNDWPGAITREFSKNEHLVRVKKEAKDVRQESENIKKTLEEGLKAQNYTIEIEQTDSVGSATGSRLWTQSFYAILFALISMLLYIGIRFLSISYSMGAIVALFHDALIILTVFLVFNKEISINVIGAILAVLGYSVNDTIVIFSRVRDNFKKFPNLPIKEVINLSINETLSRTILTTISTFLVVLSIYIFGGEALSDLSLALLIGIIFGTYSTIFIANPVLLRLYKSKKIKVARHGKV